MIPVLINDTPVTCINQAAVTYHVPATLILSIMKNENGRNGQAVRNKNGTYDLGVMQINSRWLATLKGYGYTRGYLQFDACKNVMAGTWILARGIANAHNLWSGMGDYHSHTEKYNVPYQKNAYEAYRTISVTLNA